MTPVELKAMWDFVDFVVQFVPEIRKQFERPSPTVADLIMDRLMHQMADLERCVGTMPDRTRCHEAVVVVDGVRLFCTAHRPTGRCRAVMTAGALCLRPAIDFCDEHKPEAWYLENASGEFNPVLLSSPDHSGG